MGAIGGLMGTAGGANGSGFSKPVNANILAPTDQGQVNQANQGVGQALGSSQALLSALQGQGGAANQSTAYGQGQGLYGQIQGLGGTGMQQAAGQQQQGLNNAIAGLNGANSQGAAMQGQSNLASGLAGAGGIQAQQTAMQGLQDVYGRQGQTMDQLQGIANGTGPNPAQAALNQATGQNVANQAAMMAGQRGAGANVGLMARQASQQGAATQQQAAGQAATMQAQQQMNAIGQMGAQQQAMGNTAQSLAGVGAGLTGAQQAALQAQYGQGAGAMNQLQAGIGQQYGQGAGIVNQQQGQLGMNAGIAQSQVGNLMGATNQNIQGNVANAGQQMGAMGNYNTAGVNMQGNMNNNTTSLANTNMQGQQAMVGGMMNGAGQAMSSVGGAGAARGGMVGMAEGGEAGPYAAPTGQGPVMAEPVPAPAAPPMAAAPPQGPVSAFGQFLAGGMSTGDMLGAQPIAPSAQPQTPDTTANSQIPSAPQMGYGSQELYKGASKMSEGAAKMGMAAAAARGGTARDFRIGGGVKASSPGEKATKPGNSYSNDKVKALLSEGEIVLPRTVTQAPDPVAAAADFVGRIMAKRKGA